jgi:hypothetical protein
VSRPLLRTAGGEVLLPSPPSILATRADGGNLVVMPPRPVWERSELTADELVHFSFLVAATGRAMLDVLPQLEGGCVNYWEAGNWALNDAAEPPGRKRALDHRRMHLHLLGRSPHTTNPAWAWGESPRFPAYAERDTWGAGFERFTPEECRDIVARARELLAARYGVGPQELEPWPECTACRYPVPPRTSCPECPPRA